MLPLNTEGWLHGCFSVSDTHRWKDKSRGKKKQKKPWFHHVSFSTGENVLTPRSHATRLQTLKEVINQSRLFSLTINYALTFHSVFMIRKAWVIYVDGGSRSLKVLLFSELVTSVWPPGWSCWCSQLRAKQATRPDTGNQKYPDCMWQWRHDKYSRNI